MCIVLVALVYVIVHGCAGVRNGRDRVEMQRESSGVGPEQHVNRTVEMWNSSSRNIGMDEM